MNQKLGFGRNSEERIKSKDKYPNFTFENRDADLEFVKLVKEATQKFDFNELPQEERNLYKKFKKNGLKDLRAKSKENILSLKKFQFHCGLFIGRIIFEKLSKDKIEAYLPFNDFRLFPIENKIIVQCRGLKKSNSSQGKIYYSFLKPKVEIDGNEYIVAFSKHAIEQICRRINPVLMNYFSLGDIYAYLEENTYFEICTLRDGNPAITFWDLCVSKEFWHYRVYVEEVLGKENLILGKGNPYFRVGYCPIAFDGEFVVATTLLFPGYSKTPEYEYIANSSLPYADKELLIKKITQQDAKSLLETGDFSGIKWLHKNALPQVIQINGLIYDHFKTFPSIYHKSP